VLEVNIGWKSKQVLDAAHAFGTAEPPAEAVLE
jgi:hypothetical protein